MDYIASGSIASDFIYKVVSASITYNAVVYNVDDEFTGVTGVATFTGSGLVIDTINLFDLSTELIIPVWDGIYPEQLELYDFGTEVVQNQNGTIYPERLELYNLSTELGYKKKTAGAMLVYSKN